MDKTPCGGEHEELNFDLTVYAQVQSVFHTCSAGKCGASMLIALQIQSQMWVLLTLKVPG